jgi:hypothetical protein
MYEKTKKDYDDAILLCELSENNIKLFNALTRRWKQYIMNYTLFQTIGKASEMLAISLSVCTLTLIVTQNENVVLSAIISMFSILFVVYSLYLNAGERSREYIIAWRKCDSFIQSIISIEKGDVKEVERKIQEIPDKLHEIEKDLKTEEA